MSWNVFFKWVPCSLSPFSLQQEKVVAVNAASAYHAGGGFSTGGRHALEEAMCVQSSLYESLERGVSLAEDAKTLS